ncbi:hypothetical protein AGLY_005312 [Aphis glycines]|uniref:UDP-N-acetylglucosamine transferase subunit ALG13 n=1 Tax=Aphis glycines TaxID=307491 RepID=A0A6G0TWV6_APHGL|nr:hypothetical protein AGLY_005312 [Aphis glycines]
MSTKTVFVTVGTTKFDELINTVTDHRTLQALKRNGYTSMILQIGNGTFVVEPSDVLEITSYKFKPDIGLDMINSDLIISHGGAGSIMQALDYGKPLLVVINEKLMNNHQYELAEKLCEEKYLYYTTCENLWNCIENLDFSLLNSLYFYSLFLVTYPVALFYTLKLLSKEFIILNIFFSSKNDLGNKPSEDISSNVEESTDIMDSLDTELESLSKKDNVDWNKFSPSVTGVGNCLFISTTVEDPCDLMYKILEDLEKTKVQKTKFLLRMLPISVTCKANLVSISSACTNLLPKYFSTEPTTFAIMFNHRYNNSVKRDEVIKELANQVVSFGQHTVDLSGGAKMTIIVEVVKSVCCLSVVRDYGRFCKFNLLSVCGRPEKRTAEGENGDGDNSSSPKVKKQEENEHENCEEENTESKPEEEVTEISEH